MMTNYRRKTIKIDEQLISYLDSEPKEGDKPVLVFLHGWGTGAESWHKQLDFFSQSQQDFRVLALDFPGFGQSQLPRQPLAVWDYSRLTSEWLKALRIDDYILIGHSFGGRVIIRGYEEFFTQAQAIILTGSAGLKDNRSALRFRKKVGQVLGQVLRPIKKIPFLGAVAEKIAWRWRSSDYQNLHGVMAETFKKVIDEDLAPYLPKIDKPSLLLWGEKDEATPVAAAHIFRELIPNSHLLVFEAATHFVFQENPEQFNHEILLFLDEPIDNDEPRDEQINN